MDINLLNRDEAAQLRDLVSSVNKVALLCHINADGDALGSTLTWARYLEQQGKEATIIVPDMYPDFLQWMPGANKIRRAVLPLRREKLHLVLRITVAVAGEKISLSAHYRPRGGAGVRHDYNVI